MNKKQDIAIGTTCFKDHANRSLHCLKESCRLWLSSEDTLKMHFLDRAQTIESKSDGSPEQPNEFYTEKQKMKMSTLKEKPAKVDNFKVRGRPKTYKKRQLPEDRIKQLHKEGMGTKAIATYLKREQSITVSYKTIQRVLSGERI